MSNNKDLLINEAIRDKEVRAVDSDGTQLGILTTKEALDRAVEKNLDLVCIAPQAKPPVCKIMDYGKYRFELIKREKEARKNQKTIEVKEVRMSLNIDTHDLETKINAAKKFLAAGSKVKVAVRYRGRELAHPEMGKGLLEQFKDACAEVGAVEKPPKMEGRSLTIFIASKAAK